MPRLIDIVAGPWAITPEMLLEIQGIYSAHVRGPKINIEDLEKTLGRKLDNKHGAHFEAAVNQQVDNRYDTFSIVDGIAIIPLDGVISKRMNLFSQISGGASTEMVGRDIKLALADPAIKGIILNVDSPGGAVDGVAELSDLIFQSRGVKPVVAYSDGMVCSAAYWIASAADSVWISGDTNMIGSIGVVAAHRDISAMEASRGIKTTEITAGKYKRIASQYAPLSEDGQADIQGKVDYIYSAFVGDVARNRCATVDTVLADMADGRVFTGKQSITNGLVDGVSTMDDLISNMSAGCMPDKKTQSLQSSKQVWAGDATDTSITEDSLMNREELKAKFPDLYQAVFDEGKTSAASETVAAVTAEKVRIVGLVSAAFGEESSKKFASAVDKGLTAEDFQTLGISFTGTASGTTVDQASRMEILNAVNSNGQQPLNNVTGETAESEQDFKALLAGYQKAHPDASLTDAMRAVVAAHPTAHEAYINKTNAGRN